MSRLPVKNPFSAPVYHEETVSSTMDVSRVLAGNGEPHGTVISADYQEAGRGRIRGRPWEIEKGNNLLFTILLRFPGIAAIPPAITLRTGLAVALAIEDVASALSGRVMLKWPNDVLIRGVHENGAPALKVAGILTEAENGNVHIGIGINVAQKMFPAHLRDKATSIDLAVSKITGNSSTDTNRLVLLEAVLVRLHDELCNDSGENWKKRIEDRLYKKGEQVTFADGAADSGEIITGTIAGIGPGGLLMLMLPGETAPRPFVSGELILSSRPLATNH
jgi:BirA family biotin operon repressor/biotin-[acetyl-CoA-carboxylase] ligase